MVKADLISNSIYLLITGLIASLASVTLYVIFYIVCYNNFTIVFTHKNAFIHAIYYPYLELCLKGCRARAARHLQRCRCFRGNMAMCIVQ